ncbi:hypothetical protein IWW34DRAFT_795457 [Fusarium oxysporum f. sp. albedinis]|nr:hypothetical protein IWW34DRAFT_795457 [Fusarium oxysporum f. sp. albedinis]
MEVNANNSTSKFCFVASNIYEKLHKFQDFPIGTVKKIYLTEIFSEKDPPFHLVFSQDSIKKDDDDRASHCIRARDLSPSLEPERDTQNQSKGQNGDSLPRINLILGKVFIIYWADSEQLFARLLLPFDNPEFVTGESAEQMGLPRNMPSCYQYDTLSKSFSLTLDYEDNGRKCFEPYFPMVFFDDVKFPSKSSVAWAYIDCIQEWDKEKAQTIEHSQQAINYVKEQAKSQTRHYGFDDEILDSETDDDQFSQLPSRLPSTNLQPGAGESDREIILETQEEQEVSIGQEKPASLRGPSKDCLSSIESKDLLNESLDLEKQFLQFEQQVIDNPPASNRHNIVQATQMASICMKGAQEGSQTQQSIITWRPPYPYRQVSSANLNYASTELAQISQSPPVPGSSTLSTLLPVPNLPLHGSTTCGHQALKPTSTPSSEAFEPLLKSLDPTLRPQDSIRVPEASVSFVIQAFSLVHEDQVQPHILPQQAAAVIPPSSLVGEGHSATRSPQKRAPSQQAPRQALSLAQMCKDPQLIPTSYSGSVTKGRATVSLDPLVSQHPIRLQSPQDYSEIGILRFRLNTPGNWESTTINSPIPVEVGTSSGPVYPRSALTFSSLQYSSELQTKPTLTKDQYLWKTVKDTLKLLGMQATSPSSGTRDSKLNIHIQFDATQGRRKKDRSQREKAAYSTTLSDN